MKYGTYVLVSLIDSGQFSDVRANHGLEKTHVDIVVKPIAPGDEGVALTMFMFEVLSRTLGLKEPVIKKRTKRNILTVRVEENPGRTQLYV